MEQSLKFVATLMIGTLVMGATAVQAQFDWTTNSGGIQITGYTGPGGEVVVPDMITGLPVTSIGDYAFYQKALTGITFPNTLTNVGTSAFHYCGSLTNVSLPTALENIENYAFYHCDGLTNLQMGANLKAIGDRAFGGCSKLASITFPNSLQRIGESAFESCGELTTVVIPDSVTHLGDYAFLYDYKITSVTIVSGKAGAFYAGWGGVVSCGDETES